jgi:hypothetical protein
VVWTVSSPWVHRTGRRHPYSLYTFWSLTSTRESATGLARDRHGAQEAPERSPTLSGSVARFPLATPNSAFRAARSRPTGVSGILCSIRLSYADTHMPCYNQRGRTRQEARAAPRRTRRRNAVKRPESPKNGIESLIAPSGALKHRQTPLFPSSPALVCRCIMRAGQLNRRFPGPGPGSCRLGKNLPSVGS